MEFLQPTTWRQALEAKSANPKAVPIQGGTDVMVELNFDRHRPPALLDLNHVTTLLVYLEALGALAGHAARFEADGTMRWLPLSG